MNIPKEARDITLAVLREPELHYRACYEDTSGRPDLLNCICPLKEIMKKIAEANIEIEVDEDLIRCLISEHTGFDGVKDKLAHAIATQLIKEKK